MDKEYGSLSDSYLTPHHNQYLQQTKTPHHFIDEAFKYSMFGLVKDITYSELHVISR